MIKVLYLHGRPSAHKLHARFAESVGSDFQFIDPILRWQDRRKSNLYKIISWILCAFWYPRNYDYYLVDNLHLSPVIMKKLGLISKRKKIIAHLGSHTLFFIYSGWYSKPVNLLHRYMLKNYDYLLCEGKMAEELVHSILGSKSPKTIYTFLGPPKERSIKLQKVMPKTGSKQILHISSGPDGFRTYYKGIMDMVKAFKIVLEKEPDISFCIVGDWGAEVKEEALSLLENHQKKSIKFAGVVSDIENYLMNSDLYLHCTNGDAFPTASVEAMTAGIVPIVSEWTGTKQIVNEINQKLVVHQKPESIAEGILWYYQLDNNQKQLLSKKARKVVTSFTEESAVEHYQNVFGEIIESDD